MQWSGRRLRRRGRWRLCRFCVCYGVRSFGKFYLVDLTVYYTSPSPFSGQRQRYQHCPVLRRHVSRQKRAITGLLPTTACDVFTSPITHVIMYNFPVATIAADGPVAFCAGGSVSCILPLRVRRAIIPHAYDLHPLRVLPIRLIRQPPPEIINCWLHLNISGCADYSNVIAISASPVNRARWNGFPFFDQSNPSDGMFTIEVEGSTVGSVQIEVGEWAGQRFLKTMKTMCWGFRDRPECTPSGDCIRQYSLLMDPAGAWIAGNSAPMVIIKSVLFLIASKDIWLWIYSKKSGKRAFYIKGRSIK